jgi:hypothetical protein
MGMMQVRKRVFWNNAEAERLPDAWRMTKVQGDHDDRKRFPFKSTEFTEQQGSFSPSGRWVAFASDRSGRPEIYVSAFASAVRTQSNCRPAGVLKIGCIDDSLTDFFAVSCWPWRLPVSSRRADHAVAGMLIFGRAAGGPPVASAPSAKGDESAADRSLQTSFCRNRQPFRIR